jgi:hypothetical protein
MKIEDTEPIPETGSSRPRKTYTNDSSRRKKETLLSKDTTTGSSTSLGNEQKTTAAIRRLTHTQQAQIRSN